jgi:hypothetical protein
MFFAVELDKAEATRRAGDLVSDKSRVFDQCKLPKGGEDLTKLSISAKESFKALRSIT